MKVMMNLTARFHSPKADQRIQLPKIAYQLAGAEGYGLAIS
jgi:hypothetical protein